MNCAKACSFLIHKLRHIYLASYSKRVDKIVSPPRFLKVKLTYSTHSMMNNWKSFNDLHGMKVLDKEKFKKTITVSKLIVEKQTLNNALIVLKKYMFKMLDVKPVQETETNDKKILLNPDKVNSWSDFDEKTQAELKKLNIDEKSLSKESLTLGYENWPPEVLLKAVLPKDEPLTSYSMIGHIIHLNIPENLLDYKNIIGEILLDKIKRVKTVVYKKHIIDNVYRNFEMEVICGENNLITSVRENGCLFELDFSKVYWNSRLSTEHQRIVDMIQMRDVLFDVFAGIGPFAIPAAKKKCMVYANDLNPDSVKWLENNIKLNKRCKDYIKFYNKDGSEFILNDLKEHIIDTWKDEDFCGSIYVVMNLPALAPTFIKYFKGLFKKNELATLNLDKIKNCLPIIHCYYFVKANTCQKTVFETESGFNLEDVEHSFHFVRDVSDTKAMIRITFTVPFNYLMQEEIEEPLPKRICIK